jgi:NADPH:quinone reductase-like Zn-dependent oxidoreductase
MKQFWQEVLQLPYKPNSQDNPLHEQQVRELLDKHGFNYVWQPNGPQQSPDFRVTLPNGRVVDIECKSSKNTYPTYNGGLPKKGVIYIFSSKRYNETTIFFADDVVSNKKRELYASLVEELNSVLKVYQLEEEWQQDDRGFDFYIRNMYTQSGAGKKDYFKHSNRQQCESNVLNFDW